MEFKIDTKNSYTEITPVANHLNAILTDALCQKCKQLTESGSLNYVIDLQNCIDADKTSFESLAELHQYCYQKERSIVFTGLQEAVSNAIKEEGIDEVINITPTLAEAIDIINMEILERDLFKEE
jgi:anti-anti-sigma regulatory factor